MKVKKFSKWSTRILLDSFMLLVVIGGMCQNPYHTNHNLKLVVGDTTTAYDAVHCSNPVVSPDGNVIYYLCVDADALNGFYESSIGQLYVVNIDGSSNKKILDGKLHSLSISSNRKKLAVQSCAGSYSEPIPESLILVIHVDTIGVTNIDSLWVTPKGINKIEWSSSDDYVYYRSSTNIYRWDLTTNSEEMLMTITGIAGFDLFGNNSIYLDSAIVYPQLNPKNENYAIGTKYGYDQNFLMRDLQTSKLDTLPDSLNPYLGGLVCFPYWFSDGNTIVFSAQPYEAGGAPAEIWILENLFEQIEE